jgi:hypothetical protein
MWESYLDAEIDKQFNEWIQEMDDAYWEERFRQEGR